MIDGIRQNLTHLEPGSRKGAKTEAASTSSSLSSSIGGGAEVVEISSLGTGSQSAPLDRAKIDAIRAAIRNNSYPLDLEKLASRMVDSMVMGGAAE